MGNGVQHEGVEVVNTERGYLSDQRERQVVELTGCGDGGNQV